MSRSATPATQSEGRCLEVPRLPRKTPRRHGAMADQARRQSQPSAISALPATQSNNRCCQVPRLPHKVKVDVTKCHACHAKRRGVASKLCVSRTSVSKLCASCVCVQVVCEQVRGGGGRRRRAGGGRMQNQKQEPHTKMWGKNPFPVTVPL